MASLNNRIKKLLQEIQAKNYDNVVVPYCFPSVAEFDSMTVAHLDTNIDST